MYEFLSMLTEIFLPRLRDFNGIHYVQNEKSGSINFGFPPSVMVLFPQLERTFLPYETNTRQLRYIQKYDRNLNLHRHKRSNNSRCKMFIISIWTSLPKRRTSCPQETHRWSPRP
jgi:ribosomal protein L5